MSSKRTAKTRGPLTPPSSSSPKKSPAPRRARTQRSETEVGVIVAPTGRPRVNLALQGGGSHGAFTWGSLDRLLEADGLEFTGISGTSAGALNGAVMLTGYVKGFKAGGTDAARLEAQKALRHFWRDVSRHGPLFSPLSLHANGMLKPQFNFDQFPAYQWMSLFTRAFSPYEFNPLNLNPLSDVLRQHVDPVALHKGCVECGIPLFVTATSVHTGQARVFTGEGLSLDALMASACLPFMFQAVTIDGVPYWDGGFTGNPALYPLIYETQGVDILLIRLQPLQRAGNPTRSIDIMDRISEITFNASLVSEMRAIAFVKKLIDEQKLDRGNYKRLHMHMVADDEGMGAFNASSKSNTNWAFLQELHRLGYQAADKWLKAHRDTVGKDSSFDIHETFLKQIGHGFEYP